MGYGIGARSFLALGWVIGLTLIGTAVLFYAPGVRGVMQLHLPDKPRRGPRRKSMVWCVGASLNRLLPVVTIAQEFNDFFNDPDRERLYPWQQIAFVVLALCGWALGLFVVGAFSGLTQT